MTVTMRFLPIVSTLAIVAGLYACTQRLIIATPNVTKPVPLAAKGCSFPDAATDSSSQQAESVFFALTAASRSDPPVPAQVEMNFLKADPRDEKTAQITEIRAGSNGWFILLMGGTNHWLEINAETCAKAVEK